MIKGLSWNMFHSDKCTQTDAQQSYYSEKQTLSEKNGESRAGYTE